MTAHISPWSLDELTAGVADAETRAHVAECSECRVRAESLEAEVRDLRRTPSYARVRAVLRAEVQVPSTSPGRRWAVATLAGLAASALIWTALPARPTTRIKGGARVNLLARDGSPLQGPIAPGTRVTIGIGAAGHPYALLMALDEAGNVERLWPVGETSSGRVPVGAEVRLEPAFEVTPGSSALWAFFSDAPIREEDARHALRQAADEARQRGAALGEVAPSSVTGEAARASTQLLVQ